MVPSFLNENDYHVDSNWKDTCYPRIVNVIYDYIYGNGHTIITTARINMIYSTLNYLLWK